MTATLEDLEECFGEDTQEYAGIVDQVVDTLANLLDSDTPTYMINDILHKETEELLEAYEYPTRFADHIIEHAKQIYMDL